MKKSIKKTIISLALCASASCVVGGLAFMQPEHEVADAAVVAASYNTVDGFTIEDTASVRNTNPNGIRFHTVLDAATKATFDGWDVDYDVSYGTLMIPADYLGSQALTHETDSVLDVPVSKWQDEAKTTWTSVLAGTSDGQGGYNDLSESYYNRPIVARSYVKVTDGEGNTTYYYTTNTAIRSIGYVAMMEYLDPDGNVTELIEKVVEQTKVELAFNEAGMISAVQNNKVGTAFIENALPQSSDELAVLKIGGMTLSDAAKAELESWGYTYDISYTSGNQDVVGVDGTTLTAKAEGESAITASVTVTSDAEKAIREFPQASIANDTVEQIVSTTLYTGVSEYKIYINENSANAAIERQAAELMQKVLAEATGIDLPIVTSVSGSDKYISIGETTEAVAVEGWSVTAETASQLIVDETTGNAYFRGVEGKAILYGVQEFLSRHVGYEYLMENTYTVDEDVEVIFADESFVRDITYIKLQGNAVDGYGAVPYSDGVISLGTHNTDYVQVAAYHQGVAHNSVLVVDDILRTKTFSSNGRGNNNYGSPKDGTIEKWYATNPFYLYGSIAKKEGYVTIENPYFKANDSTNIDPFATYKDVVYNEYGSVVSKTWDSSPQYIPAELCYTAHGDPASYASMKAVVVNEMLARLAVDTELDRLGFSHMDHRVWCACDTCAAAGNPSDNLLKFLLDVAADVKASLTTAGDARAETFKISSLFYHATNTTPKSVANYKTALETYGKHIEVWFAETAADYTEAITAPKNTDSANKVQNGESNVNYKVYENLQGFKSISDTYCGGAMDILWWGYYGMVTQFFVPYNSLDALRANYAVAKDNGVDHMFNQMMGSQVNFTRLKEYIMGKLTWDAKPDDDTWNGWINDYFEGAYGAGADKMKSYYDAWKSWAKGKVFNSTVAYNPMSTSGNDASIWHHAVMNTTDMPLATLENWANLIDQAIVALDPNDPNYDTYYWNIKLEKATPLYLIMYIYGENGGGTSNGKLIANNQFGKHSYVIPYGEEFLEIVNYWKINSYGEGLAIRDTQNATTHATTFVGGIETALANVTSTTVATQQTVVAGNSFTLNDSALTSGTYTAKVVNANNANDKTTVNSVTVTNGTATINATLSAGATYIVELNSTTANVKFNDVLAISGYITDANGLNALSGNGYYIIANDIDCNGATISNTSFSGTLDGNNKTVSNLTVGANGIFGTLNGATVKNVNFTNLTITGSVLANSTSDTNIENVTVSINGETTMTAATVFGTTSTSSFANVAVNAENTNGLWPTGVYSKYTKAEKKQYSIFGSKDATLALTGAFVKGDTYTVSVDGISSSVIAYSANKISVTVGDMAVGAQKTVICQNTTTKDTYAFDVVCVTAAIKTAAQIAALGVGTSAISGVAGNDVAGYYLLVNDIDCAGRIFTPGHSYGSSNFIGTFDGNGYTISNFTAGDSGIFGGLKNATIKNVNFTGVGLEMSANAGWNYATLFANAAINTVFENISIKFNQFSVTADKTENGKTTYYHTGLLLANGSNGRVVFRNVDIDVASVELSEYTRNTTIFGSQYDEGNFSCTNVNLYLTASQIQAGITYGWICDPETTDTKVTKVTDAPNGVAVVTAFSITNVENVVAAGETLTLTANNESGTVTYTLASAVSGISLSGNVITVADTVLPNTAFTVIASNGDFTDKRTFKVAKWQEALDELIIIEKTVGTFTVPSAIDGVVEYVKINGITVYDKVAGIGSISGGVITCDNNEIAAIANASNQEMVIANEMYEYTLTVDVCDEIEYIETLEQLKGIGVGGLVNANNGDKTGYYMLANDITIEHADDYSDVLMAGYPHDYAAGVSVNNRFKGTFNGNGYTIHNIRVADGGIFGVMSGATIKNVNFTNVEYLRDGLPASGTSYNNGSYISLFGYSAQNTTIEDIHFTVAAVPSTYSWQRMGMLITSGSAGATTFRNITIDASGLTVDNILGISHNENSVYENVDIIAEGYFARGYTGDSYTANGANTAAMLGEFPDGITFYHSYTIDNAQTEVEIGTSFEIMTSSGFDGLTYNYALAEAVTGISLSGNTVNVAMNAAIGAQFTVVVTSNEDLVREKTFTVCKAHTALEGTVTIEAITDKLDLSALNGIAGNILSIKIESSDANVADLTVFSGNAATAGEFTMASRPVNMAHLGENKTILIETDKAIYTVNANVYTMIIDNAAELEMFYDKAADNALAAGLNIEAQKGFVHSGYFVLGADIEYNKVWQHIPYGTRWALCYDNAGIWVDGIKGGTLLPGAIQEDWGAGDKGGFRGVFDGNGHAIVGLQLQGEYAGFIGTMGVDGVLKEVAFTNLKLGEKTGLVERGGRGGFVENVYIELDSIVSGTDANNPTKLMTQHGNTKLTNVIVNVTECDFTGVEYVYLLNSAYNVSENIYVIDRDKLIESKTDFTDTGATAFWHFNYSSDKGGKFATVDALLADATHGAIVASLGGYWSVEDGNLYFGTHEVVIAAAQEVDMTEYRTDINNQITVENANFTVGSVWSVSINGGNATPYTVTEAGQATVTVDPATIDGYQAKVVFSNETAIISCNNVIAITYITNLEELKAIGMGNNNTTATAHANGYYVLANDINVEHAGDYSDVVTAGYHAASSQFYFTGIFDGNNYTIDNMRVSDGGIFGYMENATVRNLTLTNVHILDTLPAGISTQNGGYAAILAYTAPGTTFEDIEISIASSPAAEWTWKRYGLFVASSSGGAATYRDITVDASYVELKFLLGIAHKESNVYENVVIKAAKYHAIGYTADSYSDGVDNVAAKMTEFPAGIEYITVAHVEIPNQPMNENKAKLPAYTGDVTAVGFAEGANVFEIVNDSIWDDRILFPADSDNYDYVEFDVVPGAKTSNFTAWPQGTGNTEGSFGIYGAQMTTEDSRVRTIQVFDKDGNTLEVQHQSGFEANTFYTIRICFVEGETVKFMHFGTSTAQTYYVSAARWGNFDVENDVYDNTTGTLLPKYEGDETALGFAEDSVVTQVTIADSWENRVGINANIKYDYVDVKFSFTGDRQVNNLTLWTCGTDANIRTGNYSVTASGGVAANGAEERTIQIFDANYNAVSSFVANTVYTLRVYLNDNISTFAVSTFDTSAESSAILNFGDITYGNEVEVNETVEISVEDGTFTLPDAIEGTVKAIMVDGAVVYSSTTGSLNGKDVAIDVELTAGAGKILTVITDGDTYVMRAVVKVPDVTGVAIQNTSNVELTAYTGDTTSMGFKAGDNVYEIVNSNLWSHRILIPADSDNYDYVEFDLVPGAKTSNFTAWPSSGNGTQGSFGIYGAQMNPADSAIRSVHVWDANGNTFAAQYTSGFAANTFYTIRVCFAEGETLKFLHFGTSTAQTYYISSARWGTFGTQNDVYVSKTGALLAKYEGDVTALGFDAGSTVTQVSLAGDAWNNRVGVYGNVKYDYVDVEFSFTGDRTVYSLCVWAYGTNASILTGNYTVNAAGCTPVNGASDRKAYILDAQGADVASLAANTVYTLRVFLNGDTSAIAVSTFDTSADSSAILNFGDITYGNAYESDEYIILLPATGSFTLPDDINGTVKYIYVDGTLIYSDTVGSLDGNIGMYDADFAVGTEYDVVVYTHENDTYYLKAIGADAIIKTAQELQALGVGGRTVDGVKQGQGNSDVAGNDVTGYYVIANDIDASGIYFAAGYTQYESYFRGTVDGLGHTVNNVIVSEGGIFGGMYNATVKNVTFAGVRYHGSSCGMGYNNNQNWGQYFGLFAHWADKITVSNVKVVIEQMEHRDWTNVALFSNRFQTANVSTFTNVEVDATGIALNTALGYQHTGENIVYDNVSIKAASVNVIAYSDDGTTALTEWPTGITYTQDATMVQYEAVRDGSIITKYAGDETKLGFADGTTVFVAKQDARSSMWAAGSVLGYTMEQQKTMIYKNAEDDYASILFAFDKDIASYGTYIFFCWYYIDGANKGGGGYLTSSGAASGCPEGFNVAAYNLDGTQATSFKANTVYELRWYGAGATAFGVGYAGQNANPEMINVYWANPSSGNDA